MFKECSYAQESEKHVKHWQLSWFRYETFITLFKFRFSTQGERDTIFTMLTVLSDPSNARVHPAANNWTGLAQTLIPNRSVKVQISIHCFFKITKNPSPSLLSMTSFTSPVVILYLGFSLWHLWLSHPPRARMNTCVNVRTYQCT